MGRQTEAERSEMTGEQVGGWRRGRTQLNAHVGVRWACSPCDPGKDGVGKRDEPESPSRLLPVWLLLLLLLKLLQLDIFLFYFYILSVPVFPPQSSDI